MKDNFRKCYDIVSVYEGGYVNHPNDPGGPTNMGITQQTLSNYLGHPASIAEVKRLTKTVAGEIYKMNYWDRVNGDNLPAGVDLAVFDYAVNSGVSRAARELQKLLGVTVDGIIGLQTLGRLDRVSAVHLIKDYCEDRLAFMKRLRIWSTFGRGWQRRVMGQSLGVQEEDTGIIDYATKMAQNAAFVPHPEPAPGKAPEDERKTPMLAQYNKLIGGVVGSIVGVGVAAAASYGLANCPEVVPVDFSQCTVLGWTTAQITAVVMTVFANLGVFLAPANK